MPKKKDDKKKKSQKATIGRKKSGIKGGLAGRAGKALQKRGRQLEDILKQMD